MPNEVPRSRATVTTIGLLAPRPALGVQAKDVAVVHVVVKHSVVPRRVDAVILAVAKFVPATVASKLKREKSRQSAPHATGAFWGTMALIAGASKDNCKLVVPAIEAIVVKEGSHASAFPDGTTDQEHTRVVAAVQDTEVHPPPR
jgi:hypothetical protein